MALRSDASGDTLTRSTNLPSITAFTLMAWVNRVGTGSGEYESVLSFGNGTAAYALYITSGGVVRFALTDWLVAYDGSALSNNVWYHLAMTCSGTGAGQLLGYRRGVLEITGNGAAITGSTLQINAVPAAPAEWANMRVMAFKAYSAVLTGNEIAQESNFIRPVRTANLNTWLPCVSPTVAQNAIDYSGNAFNMTTGGIWTIEDGPPISWAPRVRRRPKAATAQTIAVGQALETDTAQAITRQKRLTLGQALETDTAQVLAPKRVIALGQTLETDTAQALNSRKIVTVGQASETDTAQVITEVGPQTVAVGQALETDTAQALTHVKRVAVGLALETESAQAFTSRKIVTLNQAIETDLAQAIGQTTPVGQSAETDTAQAITIRKTAAISQAAETDTAQALTPQRIVAVGQALETDSAQALTTRKVVTLGQALETDTAQSIVPSGTNPINQAIETDTAQPITSRKVVTLGFAPEGNLAQAFTARKPLVIGQASETSLAQAILLAPQHRLIGLALETDLSQPITTGGPITVAIGQAMETESAQALTIMTISSAEVMALIAPLLESLRRLLEAADRGERPPFASRFGRAEDIGAWPERPPYAPGFDRHS